MSTAIHEGTVDIDAQNAILQKFGSIAKAFMTLFKSISGGEDWGPIYDLTQQVGTLCSVSCLVYIVFVWLSVTNIITALFVDKAMRQAKPQADEQVLEKHKEDLSRIEELTRLFLSMDKDGSATLTYPELVDAMQDSRISSYFELQGLDIKDVQMFFKLLAQVSGSTEIDREAFVSGCLRMKGYATNVDIFCLLHQNKAIGDKLAQHLRKCKVELRDLHTALRSQQLNQSVPHHGVSCLVQDEPDVMKF